ncbi:MAG: DNA polymerase III subunit delta [Candidatus Pacebacteria bacterium]|nr:DNA polymerase III subunit delta [Candidatus Paceibacterota bacterium]
MENKEKKTNITFFFGDDDFSISEEVRSMKKEALGRSKGIEVRDFDFAQKSPESEAEVRNALRGNSLFSMDKMIVIKNFFSSGRKEEAREGLEDFIFEQLEKLGSRDEIIFVEEKDLDKRSRAYKIFEKLISENKVIKKEFPLPLGFKFNFWLENRIKSEGATISKSDLDLLSTLLGRGMEQKERNGKIIPAYDLHQAANEIDKLVAHASDGEITKEDILLLVSASSDMNIFSLIESIGKKDRSRALSILSGQIDKGFNENYILTMFVYHFRNLILTKSLLDDGLGKEEIVRRTKSHPFVVEKNIGYCRSVNIEYLTLVYHKLYNADVEIKTGRMEPELALDLLVSVL